MQLKYIFGKQITLNKYYKQYKHLTSYTSSSSSIKGYISDTVSSIYKRQGLSDTIESKSSYDWNLGVCDIYTYGSVYQLSSPTITEYSQNYDEFTVKIYNPNDMTCVFYLTGGSTYYINAGESVYITSSWDKASTEEESKTISGYLGASDCTDSSSSSCTVDKDVYVKPTIDYSPSFSTQNNTYTQYTYRVTNNNDYDVYYYSQDESSSVYISAGSYVEFDGSWSYDSYTSESKTVAGYFYKSGYTDSSVKRYTINKPTETKSTCPSPSISINGNSYQYVEFAVTNPNTIYGFTFYYDSGSSSVSVGAGKTVYIQKSYSGSSMTLSGYFAKSGWYDSSTVSKTAYRPDQDIVVTISSASVTGSVGGQAYVQFSVTSNTSGSCSWSAESQDSHIDLSGNMSLSANISKSISRSDSNSSCVNGDTCDITVNFTSSSGSTKSVTKTVTISTN